MRRSSPSLVLLLSSLALSACTEGDVDGPVALDEERTGALVPLTELAQMRGEVCDPRFMVSYAADGGSCDTMGPWQGESLFPGAADAGLTGLTGYCRYTWTPTHPSHPPNPAQHHITSLAGNVGEVSPDCMAVMPQGNAITTLVADELLDLFRWRIGWIDPVDMDAAFQGAGARSPVTTAVIDTYPADHTPQHPLSDHGPVVASVVESIACGDGGVSCSVSVSPFLGLPRDANGDPKPIRGGYVGRQSDVAGAVYDAMEAQGSERLVINLSIGWDPVLFGGVDPTTAPPAVRAVHDALRIARCRGALIIAAAGNTDRLRCDERPLAPGQWQMEVTPTEPECTALGVGYVAEASDAPLVYAIGGLDQKHSIMPGTRNLGMPRLAASATHTVAQERTGLPGDVVKTGTSLSSAVASGAASLLWSFRPDLLPGEVMDLLYDKGFDVGETSTFDPGGEAIHGVDVCAALTEACTAPPISALACNGNLALLDCDPPFPVSIPDFIDTIADAAGTPNIQEYEVDFEECNAGCGGPEPRVYESPGIARDCEAIAIDPLTRFTEPQPPKNGCSDCVLTVEPTTQDATAQLTLSDDFQPTDVAAVDVRITDAATGRQVSFPMTEKELAMFVEATLENDQVEGYAIPLSARGYEVESADVVMRFDTGEVTVDPMIVL